MINNAKNTVISIITVVYNCEASIRKTIESIINQSFKSFEYIIIDGGSSDKTTEIIKEYDNKISYWISEPDNGLYHAMNKGLEKATGKYVWFINSGDEIADRKTLEKVFANNNQFADIYYGETIIIDNNGNSIGTRRLKSPKQLTWKSFINGMLVSHQSIIVKRNLASFYNLKYKYSADFDWVIQALQNSSNIENTNIILSRFLDGGQTKKTIIPGLKERFKIMCKYYGLIATSLNHIALGFNFLMFVIRHKRF